MPPHSVSVASLPYSNRHIWMCNWLASFGILTGLAGFGHAYDFSGLTALAEGAVAGEHVALAVPGFDIRILRHGQPIYHQSFGNWELDRPANVDSSTKTLSGALMMSLTESPEFNFSLDSRLGEFLPEYNAGEKSPITVRQAFSHTSGIDGVDAGSLILANPNLTLRSAAFWIAQAPLGYAPPGTAFAYGGLSMHAAGAAAEVATGQSYIDLFHQRIIAPLEMNNTQFVLASPTNPRVAGGVESTATDYARFMDMLLNGGVDRATGNVVLSAESVAQMLTRQTNDLQPIINSPTDNHRYGIGVWLEQLVDGDRSVDALAGGARGFHSWIDHDLGLVFAFATDTTSFGNVEHLSSLMHAAIIDAVFRPGDFNGDGLVNLADYNVWRDNLGAASEVAINNNGNGGGITSADYLVWKNNFTPSAAALAITAVPEPRAVILLLLLGLGLLFTPRAR